MTWIIAIGVLIVLGFTFPEFGKFTLISAGIIILIIIWFISDSNQKQKAAKSLIPLNEVMLSNLKLSKESSLYQLSGEVKNNSPYQLEDITLSVKAYDCPGSTITNDCTIVGEDNDVSNYIVVPPNQVRSLNNATYVNLYNMPPLRGNFLWSYELRSTTAKQP